MNKFIHLLVFFCAGSISFSQTISQKIEFHFSSRRRFIGETHWQYNLEGNVEKWWDKHYYPTQIALRQTEYYLNSDEKPLYIVFSEQKATIDSSKKTVWEPLKHRSIKYYRYDEKGQLEVILESSASCNYEFNDIYHFQYKNGKLDKQHDTLECSSKDDRYTSTSFIYDSKDSLITEQGTWPNDTNKIWFRYIWDYSSLPQSYLYEGYYRNNDTLNLEAKYQIVFNANHDVILKIFYHENQPNDTIFYERSKSGQLLTETYKQGNTIRSKDTYKYNKRGLVLLRKHYILDFDRNRLMFYEYFKYKYLMRK